MADPQTTVTVLSRERRQIRSREAKVTLSAWCVELELPGGKRGAIVFAEPFYRGEGDLMGTPQEKLAELWKASLPAPQEEEPPPQWG